MTAPDDPGFTVVDKRSAAQPPADPTLSEPAAPTPASPTVEPEPNTAAAAPFPEEADSAPTDRPEAPDPAMLLSLVALQMPPREFVAALLGVFDGLAWQQMGLVANPLTGQTNKDLPAAQLCIDMVQFLLGKVESTLPDSERREAQRRLNDLRMNFLSQSR